MKPEKVSEFSVSPEFPTPGDKLRELLRLRDILAKKAQYFLPKDEANKPVPVDEPKPEA